MAWYAQLSRKYTSQAEHIPDLPTSTTPTLMYVGSASSCDELGVLSRVINEGMFLLDFSVRLLGACDIPT